MATAIMKQKKFQKWTMLKKIISKISEESLKRRPTQKRTWMDSAVKWKATGIKKTDRYWSKVPKMLNQKRLQEKIRINIASWKMVRQSD